jgi:hypothetical protein
MYDCPFKSKHLKNKSICATVPKYFGNRNTELVFFQLKSDSGQVGGIVTHSLGGQEQQVIMTVDSKFGSSVGDRLMPTQVNGNLINFVTGIPLELGYLLLRIRKMFSPKRIHKFFFFLGFIRYSYGFGSIELF